MTTIRPLKNYIMFQFLDEAAGPQGKLQDRKYGESGIIIPTLDSSQKLPRWGKVLAAGPEAAVMVGEYILIEGLQWSFGTKVNDIKMWKTDDSKVIMVTDDIEETYRTSF
jgi:co-chaperonin GroES (HSP10)